MIKLHLDSIAAFVLVADEGSFSAAARKLNKSQSTVSIAVRHLEDEIGELLFSRERKQPQLTEKGKILYQTAKTFMDKYHEIVSIASTINNDKPITIRLGIDPLLYSRHVLSLLSELSLSFPNIDVILEHASSNILCEKIVNGNLDLAFGFLSNSRVLDIEYSDIFSVNYSWVKSPTYNLHSSLLRLLLLNNDIEPTCISKGVNFSIWKFDDVTTLIMMCLQDKGVALLSEEIQSTYLDTGQLEPVKNDQRFFGQQRKASLFWRTAPYYPPAVKWLLEKANQPDI
ncbi:hypothetical protein ABT56_01735 [Photobacterium aquae]|uniref:HTH lysR-type domain-containing protein n=1 Tax=Photobacterium aquae TaxID=1195763 RepID=A0A0J1HBC2_9GAMM|nr:LysR family transcriptional regulator [Photobacterium aquae]KLV08950.1 hypothetical protein ABT56_01735 [Photobacterium aquae]